MRGSIIDRWYRTVDGEKVKTDRYRKGHQYKATYRGPDGRHHSKSFDTKDAAGRWLRAELGRIDGGSWTDPGAGYRPYAEWAEEWLSHVEVKPKPAAGYRSLLDSRLLPTFGDVRLSKISTAMVRRWLAELRGEGLSPSRIRQARQVLRSSLEEAKLDGLISSNPVEGTKPPRLDPREKRYLTRIRSGPLGRRRGEPAAGRGRGRVVLVAHLPAVGEAVALHGRHVDVLRRQVTVSSSVTAVNEKLIEGTPKNHHHRTVVHRRFLAEMIGPRITGHDDLIFPAPRGGYLRSPNWRRRVWKPALADVGLDPELRIHDLRHTAASLAAAAEAPIHLVARMLGHRDASVTATIHADLYPADLEALADRLDERLSGSGVAPVLPETPAVVVPIERASR